MKKIRPGLIAGIIGLAFIGLLTKNLGVTTIEFPVSHTIEATEEEQLEEVSPPQTSIQDRSGYWIIVKNLGIDQKMIRTSISGKTINVPDSGIAYLQARVGNTFIMAHKDGDFALLYKKPQWITLIKDGVAKQYHLKKSENRKVEDISMNTVLAYQGVVLMTCSGEYTDSGYGHRLILYYREV